MPKNTVFPRFNKKEDKKRIFQENHPLPARLPSGRQNRTVESGRIRQKQASLNSVAEDEPLRHFSGMPVRVIREDGVRG